MSEAAPARRALPLLEPLTRHYWTGGAEGKLLIQRCGQCGFWQHPPQPRCARCHSDDLAPAPVSGRGRLATFTINHEPWLPNMVVPFVYAAVELVEQNELYVLTNILAPVDEVRSGMKVSVVFEQHDDVWLPMFVPESGHVG